MKTIVANTLLIVIFFTQAAISQMKALDKIFLTDQSAYEGIVIEQKPGEYIRLLRLPEKDTLKIEYETIEKMTRLVADESDMSPQKSKKEGLQPPKKVYNNRRTYGMVHGVTGGGDYAYAGFGLSFGVNLNPDFQIGLGVHYFGQLSDPLNAPSRQTFPLALDLRHTILKSKSGRFTTMLGLSGGYNFTVNGDYFDETLFANMKMSNGYYFNPSIGLRVNILENLGLMLDVGYHYNNSSLLWRDSGDKAGTVHWHNILIRGTLFF